MTTTYTIGSLFDGSGGFPLAAQQNGMKALWASEVNEFRVGVTKRHFPQMEHLGDVTEVRGDYVGIVDVITFGSPCQDLSIAGTLHGRAGLGGTRSSLFYHAVRIIEEMREATGGRYPRFGVWENVPGALSSNKGEDFRCVLESLARVVDKDATIPVPPRGKWTTSGMVAGNGWSIAWRVLDAQYFGVAQRRRRIVLVADFGGERAAELLFEREGVSGDLAESAEARTNATADAGSGSEASGGAIATKDVANAITARSEASGADDNYAQGGHLVLHPTGNADDAWLAGTLVSSGAGLNRPAGMASEVDFLIPCAVDPRNDRVTPIVGTLMSGGHGWSPNMINPVLVDVAAIDCRNLYENHELSGTLQAKSNGSYSLNYTNPIRIGYGVRRLTPRECERLQGFPDDWTAPGSDSKRYQAMGDSIAIPVFSWLFKRIKRELERGDA